MKAILVAAISSCFLSLDPVCGANIEGQPTNVSQRSLAATSNFPKLKGHVVINVDFEVDPQHMARPVFEDSQILGKGAGASPQLVVDNAFRSYTVHEDLLKCYNLRGLREDMEIEYKWLLAARPCNAMLHFNYACLLRSSGRYAEAAAQYEKATLCDKTNLDYAGQCGQMFLYLKDNVRAEKYIDRARQMSGGDK